MTKNSADLVAYQTYIDGVWCDAASEKRFQTFDPFTGDAWATLPECEAADVERACSAADRALRDSAWASITQTERGKILRRIASLIETHAERLAEVEVKDNGKLISEMSAQLKYIPEWYYYYGGLADKIAGSVIPVDKRDHFAYTLREPVGVCAMIVPWNSPLLLVSLKLAPALAAGCTAVIKPSEYASASLMEFIKLVIANAGLPPGVVNAVTGFGNVAGEALVTHPKVSKVAFTGGSETGSRVASLAAQGLKKVSLELGGKSPNIVFDDAILDDAVNGAISGIFAASGQTCVAGSRLLVHEAIHDQFVDKLLTRAKSAKLGNPMKFDSQVGPITTPSQYQKVLSYIDIAKSEGAKCIHGGEPAGAEQGGGAYFVQPTIFADVKNSMRIAQEEVFGPVLAIIKFKDEEEAIEIANDVIFGLAAGIWTQSLRRAIVCAQKIKAGTVWVNTYRAFSFSMPFGGYKASGLGRENGVDAINEYLQTKSVWINTGVGSGNPFIMRLGSS